MRRAFALTLALALPASSQTPSGVSKSVEVSVTNVDVVVTDANGKPIPDLTAADFEVRQDGKVQPLTNFSFVRNLPAAPPPAPPVDDARQAPMPAPATPVDQPQAARAHLIVFVDALHLTPQNKNRALDSLRKYLPTVLGPSVEVQFVTWDRAPRIRGPLTSDTAIVSSLIESLKGENAIGDVAKREKTRIIREFDIAATSDATTAPSSSTTLFRP